MLYSKLTFLKPLRNVVERYPTILRIANQSNAKITRETVDRCPDGWNTCLNVGIACSCWKYFSDGNISHAWVRSDTTLLGVSFPNSERVNDTCKGYGSGRGLGETTLRNLCTALSILLHVR